MMLRDPFFTFTSIIPWIPPSNTWSNAPDPNPGNDVPLSCWDAGLAQLNGQVSGNELSWFQLPGLGTRLGLWP